MQQRGKKPASGGEEIRIFGAGKGKKGEKVKGWGKGFKGE